MSEDLASLASEAFCYVTTTGRVTRRAHTIEIWFGLEGATLYMLSGNGPRHRADWVRNLMKTPALTVRIGERQFAGRDVSSNTRTKTLSHGGCSLRNTSRRTAETLPTGGEPRCRWQWIWS